MDYLGFGLLIAATCSGLALLSWGGTAYPWASPQIAGLGALTLALLALLIPVERRAAEPALPARLFADRVYSCSVASMTLVSAALFGSLVFVPLFFQLVYSTSATEAGLRMAPLMGGLIISSILGGRLVSRTGKVKRFPVAGLALGTLAFGGLTAATLAGVPANGFDVLLALLGAALGLVMPNVTTAVQSAVTTADLGVATATLAFFRSLGSAFGVAISGTILATTLRARLPGGSPLNMGLEQLRALPAPDRARLVEAYGHALAWTFASAAVVTAIAFVILLFMPDRKLRG